MNEWWIKYCSHRLGSSTSNEKVKSRSQSLDDSADDGDGDFEPSVDSMIHEFDDESTLEHDEDYESDGAIELAGLTKVEHLHTYYNFTLHIAVGLLF